MGPVISQILLSLVALLFLVPIIWMVLSALKPSAEVFTVPPTLFGSEILFSNFAEAWNYLPFGRFILNTIWVAGVGTLITLVASATAGYAFARLNFKFQGGLFILYLSTLIVPQEVIVIPMFLVAQQLGWVNSYKALILLLRSPRSGPSCSDNSSSPSPESSKKPPRSMAAGTSASSAALSSRLGPGYRRSGRLHLHHLLEQLLVAADHRERHHQDDRPARPPASSSANRPNAGSC